jgi:hypothetical protein
MRQNNQNYANMNAKDLIDVLRQLPRSDRLTLAKMLLALEAPKEEDKIDLAKAMSFAAQHPPQYRHPLIQLLAESDKQSGGNSLCIQDAANIVLSLLMLTQDHDKHDVGTDIPATVPHDIILEMNLQKILNK